MVDDEVKMKETITEYILGIIGCICLIVSLSAIMRNNLILLISYNFSLSVLVGYYLDKINTLRKEIK